MFSNGFFSSDSPNSTIVSVRAIMNHPIDRPQKFFEQPVSGSAHGWTFCSSHA